MIFSKDISSMSITSKQQPVIFLFFNPVTKSLLLTHFPLDVLIRIKFFSHELIKSMFIRLKEL